MINELCKGCKLEEELCLVKHNLDLIHKCPCPECLIKVICEKMCHLRNDLYMDLSPKAMDQLTIIDKYKRGRERKHRWT